MVKCFSLGAAALSLFVQSESRPLTSYCPTSLRPEATLMPYQTYRSAQLPCTVEYCKHKGKADAFPAATCARTLDDKDTGGVWTTRAEFASDSSRSTEEKFLCAVASKPPPADGKRETYLVKTSSPRTASFLDVILTATRIDLDTTKFVKLDDGDLLYWLKLSAADVEALEALGEGQFTSIQPTLDGLKVSPDVLTADDDTNLRISFDSDAEINNIKESLQDLCGDTCDIEDTSSKYGKEFLVKGMSGDVAGFASAVVASSLLKDSVLNVAADAKRNTTNENAAWIIQSGNGTKVSPEDSHTPFWDHNIKGQGRVVGIADSGLDHQSCFFYDSAIPVVFPSQGDAVINDKKVFENTNHRKVVQYVGYAGEDEGENGGHGTHVCGSVMGKSTQSSAVDDGMAYEAKVAFFDIGVANAQYLNVPGNLYTQMFPYAKRVGATLHSNSWGSPNNLYTSDAMHIDQYTFENQDFLVLVAAGNDGDDPATGGQVASSLGAPATAKNCLTVGATNVYDTVQNGGEDIAMFSSRGPAFDGRIKPDVMAPGRFIKSASSSSSPTNNHCSTTYMQGTSMATPVVAGGAAMVQQYFLEGYYPNAKKESENAMTPMGALVKAVLVNGAQRLLTPMANFQNSDYPNMDQGHGVIELDANMLFQDNVKDAGRVFFVRGDFAAMPTFAAATDATVEHKFLSTGVDCDKHSTRFSDTPFRATLVWHDYPATYNIQSTSLVNDLDIVVEGSDGTTHYPNGGTARDSKNNVESVNIYAPVDGVEYTVKISANTISNGPQPYSFVVSGCFWNPDIEVPSEGGVDIGEIFSSDNMTGILKIAGIGGAAVAALFILFFGARKFNNRSRVGRNFKKAAAPAKRGSGISLGRRSSAKSQNSSNNLSMAGFHSQGKQGMVGKFGSHRPAEKPGLKAKRGSGTGGKAPKSFGRSSGSTKTANTFNNSKWGNMV